MPKGMFMQGVAVLFQRPPQLEALRAALEPLGAQELPSNGSPEVVAPGALRLPFRPAANGWAVVDVVPTPWPDGMGNPRDEAPVFLAWGLGAYGPGAFPGGLARSARSAPTDRRGSVEDAERHGAFVRVRLSYVLGASREDDPGPGDRSPLDELVYLSPIAAAVLGLPGALRFFNPNADVLLAPSAFARSLDLARQAGRRPYDLWLNVRSFQAAEVPGRMLLDTVGMAQFDLCDHELIVAEEHAAGTSRLLRGLCASSIEERRDWPSDEEIDGPDGARWRPTRCMEPATDPPRRLLRWHRADELSAG